MIPTPCTAVMRNGKFARINGRVRLGETQEQIYLQGDAEHAGYELWHANGRWSDRGAIHPFDLVAVRTIGGTFHNINHSPAAAS